MIEWGGCPRKRRAKATRHPILPDFPDRLPARSYTVIPYIVAAAAIAGTAISAYATIQQGRQQAAIADYNAMLARQQAGYQTQMAAVEAALMERQAMGVTSAAEAQVALASRLTEAQVQAATTAGQIRESQIQRAYDRTQSEVRSAVGKSGVTFEGSPLLVLLENADTAGEELAINDYRTALDVAGAKADLSVSSASALTSAKLRADALRTEATYRRFGGDVSAQGFLNQANLFGLQASGYKSASMLNAGTVLLGGIGNAASPFLRYGSARA